ncbi:MAG TPA: hypothetical protein VI197_03545 [Polyangiaceae bacterium]
MTAIQEFSPQDHTSLARDVQRHTRGAPSLESAAQAFTQLLCNTFPHDIVLARVFVTVPYGTLASDVRAAVDALTQQTGIRDRMRPDTLVLSLLGTSGAEAPWNDRKRSAGHAGIPLATSDFIDTIPMVARLLRDLGVGLDWIDARDTSIVARSLGSSSGLFYVQDAGVAVDHLRRKIIAAQDFVARYGVKTVFGLGGGYLGTSSYLASIVFCKTEIERAKIEPFMGLVNRIKVSTNDLVTQGRLFTSS